MHSTPVSIARPKLANSSAIASASPTVVWITPGGRFFRLGSASAQLLRPRPAAAVQLDLEVDVAQRGRSGRSAPGRWPIARLATLPSITGPRAPGTARRSSRARSCRAASGSLHDHRHLALRQVELGQALVVVAGGGDAQRVGDRRRGHAEVGGARRSRAARRVRAAPGSTWRSRCRCREWCAARARPRARARPARRRPRRPAPGCTSPPSRRSRP